MEPQRMLTREELGSGVLEINARLIDASNATLFGTITEPSDAGETFRSSIVYKPIAGERPLWDFPEGSLAHREVAAYELSEFAGFHLIPTTVLRDGPFGPGAVQQWIEVSPDFDLITFGQGSDERLREMALLDCIINNTDRKFGHILMSVSGQLYGCDHGVTFHHEGKLRTVLWQFAGQRFTEAELGKLNLIVRDFPHLKEYLDQLLSPLELTALFNRSSELLAEGHFPYPNQNWPAVPWPPV